MPESCRICLSSVLRTSANVFDYRDGLPISVIAMIILPVKITDDDNLPQKICSNCLDILMNAFQLREKSLESDRKLRNNETDIFEPVSIKAERIDLDAPAFDDFDDEMENSPRDKKEYMKYEEMEDKRPRRELFEFSEVFKEDMRVELNRKFRARNSSKVWNFFGRLVDISGDEVGSKDFNYCSLCLKNKRITKYRKTSATSSLSNHLETIHGVTKDGDLIEPVREEAEFKQPKKRRFEGNDLATICSECGKIFSCTAILKRHMRIHGEKLFGCKLCPSRFAFKENLQRHERTHEKDHFTRFICDICGSKFAEMKSLKSHLMRVHLGIQAEKNYACPYESCTLRFERKYNLKKHIMTHTDYKPHACDYCDAAYASRGDLFKHLQKLHVGDALWSCEYCAESFRLKAELRKHYTVHFQTN